MSLHQELKSATDTLHRTLEKDLNLLREDLSIADYISLLKRFYGYYLPLERHFSFEEDFLKTHLLEKDLAFFDVKALSQIPHYSSFPHTTDKSFLMGVSYVIEGSTLGGSVLRKHFKEKLNLSDDGLHFFSGYGDQTFPHWRVFLDRLESFSHSKECNHERVIEGALFTFRSLQDWLINQ